MRRPAIPKVTGLRTLGRPRLTLAGALVVERTWPFFIDIGVAAALLASFWAILWIAKFWFSSAIPEVEIHRSPSHLPLYALYSLVRIFLAYALSLIFAIAYGYTAAYNKRIETLLIAMLDILQSIPVLSFLPGVMLAMMSLFPSRQIGIEFGAILLIAAAQIQASEKIRVSIGTQDTTINCAAGGPVVRELHLLEKYLPHDGKYKDAEYDIQWLNLPTGAQLNTEVLADRLDIVQMADFPAIVGHSSFLASKSGVKTLYIASLSVGVHGAGLSDLPISTTRKYPTDGEPELPGRNEPLPTWCSG